MGDGAQYFATSQQQPSSKVEYEKVFAAGWSKIFSYLTKPEWARLGQTSQRLNQFSWLTESCPRQIVIDDSAKVPIPDTVLRKLQPTLLKWESDTYHECIGKMKRLETFFWKSNPDNFVNLLSFFQLQPASASQSFLGDKVKIASLESIQKPITSIGIFPKLTTLDVWSIIEPETLATLPPSLTDIGIQLDDGTDVSRYSFSHLSELKTLVIFAYKSRVDVIDLPEMIRIGSQLPALTSLDTSLRLDFRDKNSLLLSSQFAQSFPKLESLEMPIGIHSDWSCLAQFPSLTNLVLNCLKKVDYTALAKSLRQVTSLHHLTIEAECYNKEDIVREKAKPTHWLQTLCAMPSPFTALTQLTISESFECTDATVLMPLGKTLTHFTLGTFVGTDEKQTNGAKSLRLSQFPPLPLVDVLDLTFVSNPSHRIRFVCSTVIQCIEQYAATVRELFVPSSPCCSLSFHQEELVDAIVAMPLLQRVVIRGVPTTSELELNPRLSTLYLRLRQLCPSLTIHFSG